jgi:hypothetical protein
MSDTPAKVTFWDLAAELQADDHAVAEGTLMGGRCMRVDGEFFSMFYEKEQALVVKLAEDRVTELIDAGTGREFAPAGKVFREWLGVYDLDEDRWRSLMVDARDFVAGRS